jgi:ribonuclease HII
MSKIQGRTWRNIEDSIAEKIKIYLLQNGGVEESVKGPYEAWQIKFSDSTFNCYKKGSIYCTPSNSCDPAVFQAWSHINTIAKPSYIAPTKDFLIGLDETGKGEVIGHTILTGVIYPKEIFDACDMVVGPADTKAKHKYEYWDDLYRELDGFRNLGFNFITEKIPPWRVDKYNLNKIMDVTYQRILSIFLRKAVINQSRIVLDDYGIGRTLERFLKFLEQQGAEVVVTNNAEDKYLEVRLASLISKRDREGVIKTINENPAFRMEGLLVGSGNAGHKQTLEWLNKWYRSGQAWPWFVKRSFKTIWEIEGKTVKPKKIIPPIREELLAGEFIEEFNKGVLSIQSLSIVCPHCGEINKAIAYAISKAKCPACNKFIDDVGITLRYYCGYVVPDSNIILGGLLSKDLDNNRFFEDFAIVIPPVVRKECDTRGGKREFERLARFASMGRIKLEEPDRVEDIPNDLSSIERDERIMNSVLQYNSLFITADNQMKAYAIAKNIFTIFA